MRVEFKNEDVFVVDGGDCQIGIESTVLLVRHRPEKVELSILRRGHVLQSDITRSYREKGFTFEFVEVVDKRGIPGHMKHHYMPPVPLIVCSDSKRTAESILKEVNEKIGQLPDEIENIKIIKPKNGIHTYQVLKLSEDPLLATREFYGKLREVAAQDPDCILFYRESHQSGSRWNHFLIV